MELTILMPCLNEAETVAQCVRQARDFLASGGVSGEVLVSDNGSTDGSQKLAEAAGGRVSYAPMRGYGAALINGIREAKGRYVIMGDADASYDFSALMPFVEKLREGCDLVMGNRFQGGIKPGAMPFLNRWLGNPVLSFLGRLFFRCPIGDFHCGLRGFNRESVLALDLQATGMEFASEMVVKAALKGVKIAEVPTTLSPDGRSRPPHLRKWRDGWRHLRLLLLFSPRWLFLYPGLSLMALGLFLTALLALGPVYVGGWRLDIHTLLFASTFLVIGLQAVFFSIFAQIIANVSMRLPMRGRFERFLKRFTLERGIVLGLLLALCGLGGSAVAVFLWAGTHFGAVSPERMMRIAIPSVTLLIAGMQTVFAAFFMNLVVTYHQPVGT